MAYIGMVASSMVLLSALGFGCAHAFEPDHMAAVSTFVAGRPSPRESLAFGLKWAAGHGLSLFLLGSFLYAIRRAVESQQPELFSSGVLDRFVGIILILLGVNALLRAALGERWMRNLLRGKRTEPFLEAQLVEQQTHDHADGAHFHPHSHLFHHHHTHPDDKPNANALWGGSVLMGLLHGAAGTGAFIGQAVAAVSENYSIAVLYTLLFSIGVLFSMGFYSFVLGGAISLGTKRSVAALRGVRLVIGGLTCAIGVVLLTGHELPGLFDAFISH